MRSKLNIIAFSSPLKRKVEADVSEENKVESGGVREETGKKNTLMDYLIGCIHSAWLLVVCLKGLVPFLELCGCGPFPGRLAAGTPDKSDRISAKGAGLIG